MSATAIASIRNVLFFLRFPVALEEEEEEEENPNERRRDISFRGGGGGGRGHRIREKELKNVIDEVDATVKTRSFYARVSKFY